MLASRITGIPELVEGGKNGWLVTAGDVEELAEMLLTVDGTLTVSGGTFAPNAGGPADFYQISGATGSDLPHLRLEAGATSSIGGSLFVGGAGLPGELTVTGGATISSNDAVSFVGDGGIGGTPGSTGTVTVDGDIDTFCEKVAFMKGRCIGVVNGNHYVDLPSGINSDQKIESILITIC